MVLGPKLEAFLHQRRTVIVAGIRRDGRPHLTPNWFLWDGERFYVSTTRTRAKYAIFRRDPRVELAFDDSTGSRTILVSGTVDIREDVEMELPRFRAIREKYGRQIPDAQQLVRDLKAEERVLLAITPNGPPDTWTAWDFS